ncbi:MAG: DUF192 domain-containing protein [Nanoarchaeota archaeon]|nr:DUF192 domain-containing protein [Nanoarchaeota archaeon]
MRGILIIALLVLIVAVLLFFQQPPGPSVTIQTETGPVTFSVEIADDAGEWSRGLMFRESLPETAGMYFIFPDETPRSFWMKNTLIPLDIIFIGSNGTLDSIQHAFPCIEDPCFLYNSVGSAQYVLEINGGIADQLQIRAGQQVQVVGIS